MFPATIALRTAQPLPRCRPSTGGVASVRAELTSLVEQAHQANFDIAVAIAQILQADAQAQIAGAPLLPAVNFNASASTQRVSTATGGGTTGGSATSNLFSTSLRASYVLDFWGRNRAILLAAEENAVVSRYNREVVALTTITTVANTYFTVWRHRTDCGSRAAI